MDWRQMNNIENIWQFLENLNEYVYATDIETNAEILHPLWHMQ